MTHGEKILRYMKKYGSITQKEAFLELGCTRLAARIKDLREDGYPIITEMAEGVNRDGMRTRFAIYRFGKETTA